MLGIIPCTGNGDIAVNKIKSLSLRILNSKDIKQIIYLKKLIVSFLFL